MNENKTLEDVVLQLIELAKLDNDLLQTLKNQLNLVVVQMKLMNARIEELENRTRGNDGTFGSGVHTSGKEDHGEGAKRG